MKSTSYPRNKVKILLLEGIDDSAVNAFREAGYSPAVLSDAMTEEELLDAVRDLHILGIRSKTQVSQRVLESAPHLLAIGCFCIGTNQVDLEHAANVGTPVFNAPFSNTRSVAELVIGEIIMLARKAAFRSSQLHQGVWVKSAKGSHEVRGKKLGIVGYGHIGPQVGLLGESLGMEVCFHDIEKKLPLGNAVSLPSLEDVLKNSDFVSLHVPETPLTRNLITERELRMMRRGSCLLNLSRGTVVDIDALRAALVDGHLAGAAVDVFPYEPNSNDEPFESPLLGLENVILTPHIGGSTIEAQRSIGGEVSDALLKFLELGTTSGAVNFPQVNLPYLDGFHRVLNIHRNQPGVLGEINGIIAKTGANIVAQQLATQSEIGYLIMDVGRELSREVKQQMDTIEANIRTRLLF
ncbi:MAG: phosphoglycerate dehydrogenase [Bdellovibrionales bacterium]|nr:phosphoglycerate dehydrogenase [Bdellovibrionales bacterium]